MDYMRSNKNTNYDYSGKVDIFSDDLIYEKWDKLIKKLCGL